MKNFLKIDINTLFLVCVLILLIRINYDNTCKCENCQNTKTETSEVLDIQGSKIEIETEIFETETLEEITDNKDENNINSFEKELFDLINEYRVDNNLKELEWNKELEAAAKIRAEEASICWSHTRPDGTQWYTVSDLTKGENLAKTYTTPLEVFEAWKNSETHDQNLRDKDFRSCAISNFIDENGTYFTSIEFHY